jgi:hypothetical protein
MKSGLIKKIFGGIAALVGAGTDKKSKPSIIPQPQKAIREWVAPKKKSAEQAKREILRARAERRELLKEASCMGAYEHKMRLIREGKGKNGKSMSPAMMQHLKDNTL